MMLGPLRHNPALLKLDLYCRGLRLDESCYVEEDGGRQILRTRAGLGSGLELLLPGGLWTNVPVTEPFAQRSPYTLHREHGRYLLRRQGEAVTSVALSPRPGWYASDTPRAGTCSPDSGPASRSEGTATQITPGARKSGVQ